MSTKDWVILIGAFTLIALLGIWYTFTYIGGYLSHQFPASMLEQVGNVLSAAGNAAFGAFVTVIIVALIVIVAILYVRERVTGTY